MNFSFIRIPIQIMLSNILIIYLAESLRSTSPCKDRKVDKQLTSTKEEIPSASAGIIFF